MNDLLPLEGGFKKEQPLGVRPYRCILLSEFNILDTLRKGTLKIDLFNLDE